MSTEDPVRRPRVLVGVYLVLSVAGLVGTWWFNLVFILSGGGDYLGSWFANAASSSAAVDILVAGAAAGVLMVVEGRRLGWGATRIVTLLAGSVLVAVAFTFPLFLALRERDRDRSARRPEGTEGAGAQAVRPVPRRSGPPSPG